MSELISGKEALIALGNGQEVEFIDGRQVWESLKDNKNMDLSMFLDTPDWCKFRIKKNESKIKIEIPKPIKLALCPITGSVGLTYEDNKIARKVIDLIVMSMNNQ